MVKKIIGGAIKMQNNFSLLCSIKIQGYRPFRDFLARLSPLEVIVGANGSGKSSLFEFLKFLRNVCHHEFPPEIIPGSIGQQIFHKPGPDKLSWIAEVDMQQVGPLCYQAELMGPVGDAKVVSERVITSESQNQEGDNGHTFLDFTVGRGFVSDRGSRRDEKWVLGKPNQLALGSIADSTFVTLFNLREYMRGWRFYDSFNINNEKIRRPVPTTQKPVLNEDCGNLSAVLFYLMTEHREAFEELQTHIRTAIPNFQGLNIKARGAPGEVIAYWREDNVDCELSLADLSDGTLRFISWATLCIMPTPPTLICIDEPDQGVHPRTLPILAGLFEKASARTQIIMSTHASYFLTQFDIDRISIMKKVRGESVYVKVKDSKTLLDNLQDFGIEELSRMHQTDELEALS